MAEKDEKATPPAVTSTAHDTQEDLTQQREPKVAKPAAATPPAAPVVQQAAKEEPPPAPKEEKPKEPKRVSVRGDDDEIPEDAEIIDFTSKSLKARLERASKSERKRVLEQLGVKDLPELEAKLATAKKAEEDAETARLAQLSKEERLAEDKARAEAERDEWKKKHAEVVNGHQIRETTNHFVGLLKEFIDPDYIENEIPLLGKYLVSKYKDEELADLPDDAVREWCRERLKAKPKIGKDGPPPPPPERVAHTNGANTKTETRPAASDKSGQEKDDYRPKRGETPEQRREATAAIRSKLGINF